jgi:hypothetical protein
MVTQIEDIGWAMLIWAAVACIRAVNRKCLLLSAANTGVAMGEKRSKDGEGR